MWIIEIILKNYWNSFISLIYNIIYILILINISILYIIYIKNIILYKILILTLILTLILIFPFVRYFQKSILEENILYKNIDWNLFIKL